LFSSRLQASAQKDDMQLRGGVTWHKAVAVVLKSAAVGLHFVPSNGMGALQVHRGYQLQQSPETVSFWFTYFDEVPPLRKGNQMCMCNLFLFDI
jgi:hypothetical protein